MKTVAKVERHEVGENLTKQLVGIIDESDVISEEDKKFLMESRESLQKTLLNTWMWRTPAQHETIISDRFFPTPHSKFHQALLEQKVQFTEAARLSKEIQLKKLEIEDKIIDLEEVEATQGEVENVFEIKRLNVQKRRLNVEIRDSNSELMQMKIAMEYRMREVKSWERIKGIILNFMKEQKIPESAIYDKTAGEIEAYFFTFLNNIKGLENSTDGAEVNNLIGLAQWAVKKAKEAGLFEQLKASCTEEQLASLDRVEKLTKKEEITA